MMMKQTEKEYTKSSTRVTEPRISEECFMRMKASERESIMVMKEVVR